MKTRPCAALLIALLTISLLTGCSVRSADKKLEMVEDAVEQRLDTVEDAVEDAVIQAILPEPTVPNSQPPVETMVPDAAARLTPEEAQAIALEHAGFSADQVQFLYTEFEIDDRIPQYDVQFHEGRWEYEYEIHAETGAILSFEKDD